MRRLAVIAVAIGVMLGCGAGAGAGVGAGTGAAEAQGARGMTMRDSMAMEDSGVSAGVHHAMEEGRPMASAHMRMTPARAGTVADSARAVARLRELRAGIERYHDYHVALADGYKPFLPNLPQKIYHFSSTRRAVLSAFHFDPAKPPALLYKRTASGYELVGAMYTAPRGASLQELDKRYPLSMAQWHEHTNICVPARGHREQGFERRNGKPLFGPGGSITNATDCADEGGRFFPVLFGWMVHLPE